MLPIVSTLMPIVTDVIGRFLPENPHKNLQPKIFTKNLRWEKSSQKIPTENPNTKIFKKIPNSDIAMFPKISTQKSSQNVLFKWGRQDWC